MTAPISSGAAADKQALRAEMRRRRRAVDHQRSRSRRIWDEVCRLPELQLARVVMVYVSVAGEPDTAPFVAWCRAAGKQVLTPEDEPDPATVDVVVVPALAYTSRGDRLGQGGGWYDRFLAGIRRDATAVGVAFAEQLVDELPVEDHDVRVHRVVTDR